MVVRCIFVCAILLAEELLAMARRAAAHCKLHVGADMIACFSWAARD
jgi:hypothetical protein